jgi:drug/metabolite transporter (DMT)-like permease
MGAFLAVISSLMWGTADFFGGFVSKKLSATKVLVLSYPVGLAFLLLFAFMLPGTISQEAIIFGSLAGVVGILAMGSLYIALAIGPMGVMSPVTAAASTFVPIVAGIFFGEKLSWIAWLGISIAIISVFLVSMETSASGGKLIVSGKGLVLAIISGFLIGTFLSIVGLTSQSNGMWTLVFARLTSSILVIIYFLSFKNEKFNTGFDSKILALVVISGALDATANALFVIATYDSLVSVTAVIASLYPAATVVLATAFLKEKLSFIQFIGICFAFTSAGILSLV